MKPIFKLATNNGKVVKGAGPRPIDTHYNGGQVAHSCSPRNAALAAVRRVTDGDFTGAQVYKKNILIAVINKNKNEVRLTILRPRMFK